MTLHYRGRHRSQYATGSSARLRSMGCGPISLANALRCATGGAIDLTGDQVLAVLPPEDEQNPATPGWNIYDMAKAASRIPGAPPYAVHTGRWSDVTDYLAAGLGVTLQGDSDQFTSGCSGTFDGDHCIFVHPDAVWGRQTIGDPICPDWRTESPAVLAAYAVKLWGLDLRFGTFTTPIPAESTTPPESSTEDSMAGLVISYVGTLPEGTRLTAGADVSAFRVNASGQAEYLDVAGQTFSAVLVGEATGLDYADELVYGGNPDGDLWYVKASEVTVTSPPATSPVAVTLGAGLYEVK